MPHNPPRSRAGARFLTILLAAALAPLALTACAAQPRPDADTRRLISGARDRVFPALVNISVVTVNYWGGKEVKGRSTGSGAIISPEGHIVTNQHVADRGESFIITMADKQEVGATLVGEDPLTDIAVLKIHLDELKNPGEPLPYARFGDSSRLRVGDYVMAMGSPFSLSRSVTLGIVSNTERVFSAGVGNTDVEVMELEAGQRTGIFTNWIQHDALIHPGNSGGPLVNLEGEIVGVNQLGGASIGFAIPSNLARGVAAALVEHGEVPRSSIGVSVRPIVRTGYDEGVLISSVAADGPADRAGLLPGDVIIAVDGEPVTVRFVEEAPGFLKRIADMPLGGDIRLAILREHEPMTITLRTERMLRDVGEQRALRAWGVTVRDITEKMARDMRLPSTDGVLVTSVRSGSPADQGEPALTRGDIILRVEDSPIGTLADIIEAYREIEASSDQPERLLLEFDRAGKNNLTLIKPRPDPIDDPPRELPRAWLGVATQPFVGRLADRLGHSDVLGYRVTRVYPGAAASQSDLRTGDIIVAVNDERLRPRSPQDAGQLARAVRRLDIGGWANLVVSRDGREVDVPVLLEGSPIQPGEARRERNSDFELSVREVTFYDRDDNRWGPEIEGVIVEQVDTGGWADAAGVRPGELLLRIDGVAIDGIETYRRVMRDLTDRRPTRVVVLTLSGGQTRVLFIEPEWAPEAPDEA